MVSQVLAQEISQLEADFCFALSDPTRLLMLYALGDAPHNVTDLAGRTRPGTADGIAAPQDLARPRSCVHSQAGNDGHLPSWPT